MNFTLLSIGLGALYLFVLVCLILIAYAGWSLAPWLPIHRRDIKRVLNVAELKEGDVFVELGSGTGAMTMAAGRVPGVKARGVELSPFLWLISWVRAKLSRRSNANFHVGSLFAHDFSDATVVYVFGMPRTNENLIKKLRSTVKPGTRIVSYTFAIDGLPEVVFDKPEGQSSVYLYVMD
jgi:precorrin-6B methylase 2